jgi:8-amino-7-oxononanoate synthase
MNCSTSIRDGIQLSNATACKFNHNDFEDLERLIKTQDLKPKTNKYLHCHRIFSMDGDCPNLEELVRISDEHHCRLVVDEAHALGVLQKVKDSFKCLVCKTVFLPYFDFRKWFRMSGGSDFRFVKLRDCLVNFAQSFNIRRASCVPLQRF